MLLVKIRILSVSVIQVLHSQNLYVLDEIRVEKYQYSKLLTIIHLQMMFCMLFGRLYVFKSKLCNTVSYWKRPRSFVSKSFTILSFSFRNGSTIQLPSLVLLACYVLGFATNENWIWRRKKCPDKYCRCSNWTLYASVLSQVSEGEKAANWLLATGCTFPHDQKEKTSNKPTEPFTWEKEKLDLKKNPILFSLI